MFFAFILLNNTPKLQNFDIERPKVSLFGAMKKIFKTPEINVYVLDVKDVLNASNDSYYDNLYPT